MNQSRLEAQQFQINDCLQRIHKEMVQPQPRSSGNQNRRVSFKNPKGYLQIAAWELRTTKSNSFFTEYKRKWTSRRLDAPEVQINWFL